MITQPSDMVGLAQTQATNQTEGGTPLAIVRPVVDKVIKVAQNDRNLAIGAGDDISVGYNVVKVSLTIHDVLVCLDRWVVDHQLSRNELCGQFIKVRSRRSLE